jgi:tetratricopeptide (TPR) repeat protein
LLELPAVLRPAIIFVMLILSATSACRAEIIHLKNGRTISAERVHENGAKVEYSIGDNAFAIPRSSVESIDTATASNVSAAPVLPLPSAPVTAELSVPHQIVERVVHDGKVDAEALRAIIAEEPAATAAAAYYVAARFEGTNGDPAVAAQYFLSSELLLPDNAIILGHHAATLLKLFRYAEAASLAERSSRLSPKAAFPLSVLGYALYQQNHVREAIQAWQQAQALEPDAAVEQLLRRAQRDLSTQSAFLEDASSHFRLRFEGKQAPAELRRAIFQTLEQHYSDLVRALGYSPHDVIAVILYTDQQFFDVTQAPSWTGAMNDGKLRIPVSGVESITPEFSRVLKHELTHSFINQLSRGRCPAWLHEGIAQLLEPRSSVHDGHRLAQLYGGQVNLPLNQLEGSFARFSTPEAVLGYAESLVTVEYIRDTYGMADLALVLRRIGEGSSTEAALRGTIHSGYAQLEQEIARYLKRAYGD